MDSPLVSVIMTNYNHQDLVKQSIEAVLSQTYRNIQLIVVDDGSTDGSVEQIRSVRDDRMEFYACKENEHIAVATNYAAQYVKGGYIAIADSDDVWKPDKLRKQVAFLEENKEYDACFTWVDIIDKNGNTINDQEKDVRDIFNASTDTQEEWLRFFFYIGNRLANPTSIVTAKAFHAVGRHDPSFVQGHDFEWWVRFTKRYRFAILEEPLMDYRRYSGGQESNTSARSEENDIRFYNEHMRIRKHFFDEMASDIFIKAFSGQFRNPGSKTEEELECEKAFMLCKEFNGSTIYSSCGIERLAELLKEEKMRKLLKEKFGFGQKDFYKMSGRSIYMDAIMQKKYHNLVGKNQAAETEINSLKQTAQDLNQLLEGRNGEIETLKELIEALKLQKSEVEETAIKQGQEIQNLQDTLKSMQDSFSWKVTKPIRGIRGVLKSGENKNEQ